MDQLSAEDRKIVSTAQAKSWTGGRTGSCVRVDGRRIEELLRRMDAEMPTTLS